MRLDSLPGTILDGKYRIERQLGKGGMGAVFLATHLGTMRTVALKVVVPELASREEFVARFQREAQAAGRLRHPNVVNVTDFGLSDVSGSRIAYLVMEYLDGQTLAEFQTAKGQPPLDLTLDILDQVALALDTAHAAGIVHRDLKPDNIWLESDRRGGYNVKVLDFGIAKLADPAETPMLDMPVGRATAATTVPKLTITAEDTPTIAFDTTTAEDTPTIAFDGTSVESVAGTPTYLKTRVGSVMGTPAYMSPEQCRGDAVDHRADIYSLAVIAYELLTGKRPFHSETLSGLLTQQIEQAPRSPMEHAPVPQLVAESVLRGLEKDPAKRPPTAGTLTALLRVGAEGDFGAMRRAKDLFNSYPSYFFPTLVLCFSPLALMVITLLQILPHVSRSVIPESPILLAGLIPLYAGTTVFCLQLFKAASCRLLRSALDHGAFRPMTFPVAKQMLIGFPALVWTQLVSLVDIRLVSFRDNLLWPVVLVLEGKSGRAAIRRSAELCRTVPATALNFVPRQYAPALLAAMIFPALLSVSGGDVIAELIRAVRTGSTLGYFWLLWPIAMLMMYAFIGSSYSFLYWLARWCRNEGAMPVFPTSDVRRAQKRGVNLRPGMIFWWFMPVVLLLMVLRGVRASKYADYRTAITEGRGTEILRDIDAGAPVDLVHHGLTPLMFAASHGDVHMIEELLKRGAKVQPPDDDGDTPLLLAANFDRPDVAEILLAHGASIDRPDKAGHTPLIHAATRGNIAMVKLLLAKGADRSIRDAMRKTAADDARQEGHTEILELLEK